MRITTALKDRLIRYKSNALRRKLRTVWQENIWYKTSEKLPTTILGEQIDVIFCSPGWPIPLVGMYDHLLTNDPDVPDWYIYDQINDRYRSFGGIPAFWIYIPKVPK